MIRVSGLKKTFDGLTVLDGIDFSIEKGDVVAVIGASGSGKTTFLRCLNFLEKADSGLLEFDGRTYDLSAMKKKEIRELRMKTGFVFQGFHLFENKTALENGIKKTALIIVGNVLGSDYELSKLYDKTFETEFRKAEK